MDMAHKIRRKSDGLFWDKNRWWDANGRIFKTTKDLISYLINEPDLFPNPSDIEVVSYKLEPHSSKDLKEWSDYNIGIAKKERKRVMKDGRFLFAIMASNLTSFIRSKHSNPIILAHKDGWFSVAEIISKTSLTASLIRDIVSFYKMPHVYSLDEEDGNFKRAFCITSDYSQIRLSPISEERLSYDTNNTEKIECDQEEVIA